MKPPQAEHARKTKLVRALGVASACLLPVIAAGCGGVAAHQRASSPPVILGPSFAAPVGYATGRAPSAVAIADLNGDGKGDLVTANSGGGTVSVLINRQNQFDRRQDYKVARPPVTDAPTQSVAIADLNADGKPDIASVGGRKTVSVLRNRGDGTFQQAREYESGGSPQAIAAGDLNGDSRPDLAVADGSCCVSILLNTGARFANRVKYRVGDNPMSLAIADLNGDASADLATASGEGDSSLLLNRGDGTFQQARKYDIEAGPSWVVAADFDGKGAPDLAVASNDLYADDEEEEGGPALYPAWVYLFANKGKGALGAAHTWLGTFGYVDGIDGLAVGDLNRDGKPDLVAARYDDYENGFLSLLLNRGDGSFRERLDYRVGSQGDTTGDVALAVGDLNGDARLDVATADGATHTVTVLLSAPELCDVQDVAGKVVSVRSGLEGRKLPVAKQVLTAAHCGVGTIRYAYSDVGIPEGRVTAQKPEFGAILPGGSKVNLVVSKGRHK